MAQVVIEVDGRAYTMQCQVGEEEHLKELAQLLNAEVVNIRQAVGQVGDIRLLMMAGLVIGDKLSDAARRIEELQDELQKLKESRNTSARQTQTVDETIAQKIHSAKQQIDALIARTQTSDQGKANVPSPG